MMGYYQSRNVSEISSGSLNRQIIFIEVVVYNICSRDSGMPGFCVKINMHDFHILNLFGWSSLFVSLFNAPFVCDNLRIDVCGEILNFQV